MCGSTPATVVSSDRWLEAFKVIQCLPVKDSDGCPARAGVPFIVCSLWLLGSAPATIWPWLAHLIVESLKTVVSNIVAYNNIYNNSVFNSIKMLFHSLVVFELLTKSKQILADVCAWWILCLSNFFFNIFFKFTGHPWVASSCKHFLNDIDSLF